MNPCIKIVVTLRKINSWAFPEWKHHDFYVIPFERVPFQIVELFLKIMEMIRFTTIMFW